MTSLRLLFVCTGNICRSPSAEYLLRARLENLLGDEAKKFQLGSAGLGTPGGWEMDPKVAHLLQEHGIEDRQEFRSRRVDAEILTDADLILTGTKQHRLTIGADFPEAYSRTFTMREAAALLCTAEAATLPAYDVVERGRAAIALLQRARSTRVLQDDQFDIADPHGHRAGVYKTMFQQVNAVVDVLSFVLAPASVRGPRAVA
jgi:protein-tyrosine-phosphatase